MIRLLIADSSDEFAQILNKIMAEEWGDEIIGRAKTGAELYTLLEKKPDLLFLDMFLPPMDGFHVIEQLMARSPMPVVMTCSSAFPQDCDLFQEALNRGALLVFPKPTNLASARVRLEGLRDTLMGIAFAPKQQLVADIQFTRSKAAARRGRNPAGKLVAVVGSTGAVECLRKLISMMPAKGRAAIAVAQHMHGLVWDNFCERLVRAATFRVMMARGGEILREGDVLLSPVHSTLMLSRSSCGGIGRLEKAGYLPGQIPLQPNIDAFLASTACFGRDVVAVILSGIGHSGVLGSRAVREAGGEVWVQNPRTALVGSMPAAVQEAGLASRVLEAEEIGTELGRLMS